MRYSEEDRQKVKENVSLTSLAASMGYQVIRKGAYYSIKEMDSIIIYNDRTWKRWSNKGNINGGSQIDFLLEFGDVLSVPEAIHELLNFINEPSSIKYEIPISTGDNITSNHQSKDMVLPPKNNDYKRVFAYLIKTRGLSQEVVSYFAHNKLIYEEKNHHNIVFCGYDPNGEIRYAGMRGTVTYGNTSFKCDVPGNDKNYGVNIVNKNSSELKVFESVIDLMSYMDLTKDYDSNKLVLGMVADNPLKQFLKDYEHIKAISFCLDNDTAGQNVIFNEDGYKKKYENLGYSCSVEIPPVGKDWNEFVTKFQGADYKLGMYDASDFLKNSHDEPVSVSHQLQDDTNFFRQQRRR